MTSDLPENIHPITDKLLSRADKEVLVGQHARVIWMTGLSGSGKSTLANALDRRLYDAGRLSFVLDGDNIRTGLNRGLGFSDADREENIRRIAEVSKLFLQAGVVTINSFITPKDSLRQLAREIIGVDNIVEVYVECSFETCAKRDVKGLYAKAKAGKIASFTGRDSLFEPPESPDLVVNTENASLDESLTRLYDFVFPRLQRA